MIVIIMVLEFEILGVFIILFQQQFSDIFFDFYNYWGDEIVCIKCGVIVFVCQFLCDDLCCKFELMVDFMVVDYFEQGCDPCFEVVYYFKFFIYGYCLCVKVSVLEGDC